jgi:YVTN family beta-propeller protein
MPHNVQASADGKTVWMTLPTMNTSDAEDQVVVINAADYRILANINVGFDTHPAHVVTDSANAFAYVTLTNADCILKISAVNFQVVDSFKLPAHSQPHGMRYCGGYLYVANMQSGTMSIIDTRTKEITEIPIGGMGIQAAITPDRKFAFATVADKRQVVRYDLASHETKIFDLPNAKGPMQCLATPDSKYLYVCDQGAVNGSLVSDKLYILNVLSGNVVSVLTTGNQCHGIVMSSDGEFAYVTNKADNTVSIIRLSSQSVIKTITTGLSPSGITWIP